MARWILAAGAVAWLLLAAAGFALAAAGREWLLTILPPLAIDADALGGALTAMALGLALIGVTHVAVLVGITRGSRTAISGGVLLASVLSIASLALTAAAASSAMRESGSAAWLIGAALMAAFVAVVYAAAAARLVRELGARSAS